MSLDQNGFAAHHPASSINDPLLEPFNVYVRPSTSGNRLDEDLCKEGSRPLAVHIYIDLPVRGKPDATRFLGLVDRLIEERERWTILRISTMIYDNREILKSILDRLAFIELPKLEFLSINGPVASATPSFSEKPLSRAIVLLGHGAPALKKVILKVPGWRLHLIGPTYPALRECRILMADCEIKSLRQFAAATPDLTHLRLHGVREPSSQLVDALFADDCAHHLPKKAISWPALSELRLTNQRTNAIVLRLLRAPLLEKLQIDGASIAPGDAHLAERYIKALTDHDREGDLAKFPNICELWLSGAYPGSEQDCPNALFRCDLLRRLLRLLPNVEHVVLAYRYKDVDWFAANLHQSACLDILPKVKAVSFKAGFSAFNIFALSAFAFARKNTKYRLERVNLPIAGLGNGGALLNRGVKLVFDEGPVELMRNFEGEIDWQKFDRQDRTGLEYQGVLCFPFDLSSLDCNVQTQYNHHTSHPL
ncbi:uncharacterized protein LAESUDRAFT_759547 [Laetiporus sulphureus 93-53]|uniref:F-box domain-containing protein n=1 Tax=Laetiporus sulphureus 93-53 TaxID=1314785 RepID=A0A165E790_9APHY|nr:uncharacterized protein LAESUDRAFT_759547 [Laetiporus sulphureus 93-53]KZT06375.1 hypothetical protein LAESUDRAFT_759547 [Laetiporus sulphureus 93-53]